MRIVLDTNVLVSAMLHPERASGRLWTDHILSDAVPLVLLVDARILTEYEEVLRRPEVLHP